MDRLPGVCVCHHVLEGRMRVRYQTVDTQDRAVVT